MIIFIFGAGASYGSGEVSPVPPPLGKDLYPVLKRLFTSTWGELGNDLQLEFENNFEYGMAKLLDSNPHIVAPLMQQMAIFFSRFELTSTGKNLYKNLFRELKNTQKLKEVIITTLNYECICELAAVIEGVDVDYFGIDENEKAKVWKIHGSCNFMVQGISAARGMTFDPRGVQFNGGGIQLINLPDIPKTFRGDTGLYPAMSLYAKDKPISIATETMRAFQIDWADKVKNASKIISIGVRPLEEDKHIWLPISESNADLYFIGDKLEFEKWGQNYRKEKVNKYLGNRWDSSEAKIISIIKNEIN